MLNCLLLLCNFSNKCLPSDPEAKILSPYSVSPRHSATKHPLSDTDDDNQ